MPLSLIEEATAQRKEVERCFAGWQRAKRVLGYIEANCSHIVEWPDDVSLDVDDPGVEPVCKNCGKKFDHFCEASPTGTCEYDHEREMYAYCIHCEGNKSRPQHGRKKS